MLKYLILIFLAFTLHINGVLNAFVGGAALASPLILFLLAVIYSFLIKRNVLFESFKIPSNWVFFLILYLAFGLLSLVIFNYHNDSALGELRDTIVTILSLVGLSGAIYYMLQEEKFDFRKLIFIYTICLIASSMSVIIIDFMDLGMFFNPHSFESRASGLFANPNDAGNVCAQTLLFVLFKLSESELKKTTRILLTILCFLVVYASFLTLSKTSMLTCLAFLVIYLLFNLRKNFAFISIFILLGVGIFVNQWENIQGELSQGQIKRLEGFTELLSGKVDEETTTGRSEIASYGWQYIEDHIFTGIGLGNFKLLPGLNKASHNTYLVVWGESGIIPFLIYLFLIIKLIERGVRLYVLGKIDYGFLLVGGGVFMVTYSFATNNLLDNRIFNSSLSFWLVIYFITSNRNMWYMLNKNK